MEDKKLTEQESLKLITVMINKAKDSYHDTGIGAIMWGSVIAICALVKFAEIHFDFRLPFDIYLLTFIAIIPQIFITVKEKRNQTVRSHNDIVMDYLWLAFGISIFLLIHANSGVFHFVNQLATDYKTATGERHPFRFSEHILSSFLIIYGFPTFVTGAIMDFKPMLFGGIICWICSVICVYTDIKIDLLLTALSAGVAWLIPGIILYKMSARKKREAALQHV
jgi:hypothetical protein